MMPLIADMHMHTLVSGHAYGTIREMAADAAQKKLKLIGITEHGPSVPGSCDPIYFLNFRAAPRNLYGVEVLYGCEANIKNGGQLDLGRRYLDERGYGHVTIEVDGNVSFKNARKMRAAGADLFVAGTSSVFEKDGDLRENIAKFREAIR